MAIFGGQKSNQIFVGQSGDAKPVTGLDIFATFYEWDTGKTYIWTGNNQVSSANPSSPPQGQWVEYFAPQALPVNTTTDQL